MQYAYGCGAIQEILIVTSFIKFLFASSTVKMVIKYFEARGHSLKVFTSFTKNYQNFQKPEDQHIVNGKYI